VLSTVHSAKGQEWDAVYVINVADGNFPNEYATGDPAAIEEERRLLYVALTRARDTLELIEPQRYYVTNQPRLGAGYVHGARSRFLTDAVLARLERVTAFADPAAHADGGGTGATGPAAGAGRGGRRRRRPARPPGVPKPRAPASRPGCARCGDAQIG